MEAAEAIVEDVGFVRVWVEPKGQSRLPRLELEDRLEAGFETRNPRGFGVSIVLSRTDGRLVMMFGERNDKLYERGKAILNDLAVRARQRFGDEVTVKPKS